MPQLVANEPPPHDYYADNLIAVIDDVDRQYAQLLTDTERGFAQRLRLASTDALRLFARLISRKGPILRCDQLQYPEVESASAAIAELSTAGLVKVCPERPAAELLAKLTIDELVCAFPLVRCRSLARCDAQRPSRKSEIMESVLRRYPHCIVFERLRSRCPWVVIRVHAELALYQLLFFGDAHQDLSTFVMRDLGITRFEDYELASSRRLFPDRQAIRAYVDLVEISNCAHELGDRPDPDAARELIARVWQPAQLRLLERKRCRILNRLARGLERIGEFDSALEAYARSALPPARERRVRVLQRLGDSDGARDLATSIASKPRSAMEQRFAQRAMVGRGARCAATVTDVVLRGQTPDSIEQYALRRLTHNGGAGWHLENQLPMALFALAYWDWIYAPIPGAFVNAFQSAPIDLFWPDFFREREACCVDPLESSEPIGARIRRIHREKQGVTNRLINWERFHRGVVDVVVERIPEVALRHLLEIVRADLAESRTGFPDLTIIYGSGRFEFVEVKGPGDQLQNNQKLWIDRLRQRSVPVRVLRFKPAPETGP